MTTGTGGIASTHLLAEFVASMARHEDEASAVTAATERIAAAVEAEVCAVLRPEVVVCVGLPPAERPDELLWRLAATSARAGDLPGLGSCHLATASFSSTDGYLLVARRDDPLSIDEIILIRAMARVLSLSLQMLRTLATERTLRERSERQAAENGRLLAEVRAQQRLTEALVSIEAAIAARRPISEVLDMVTHRARDVLGGDVAALRLVDRDQAGHLLLASSSGLTTEERAAAVRTRAPAVWGSADEKTLSWPVREDGLEVGYLVVARGAAGPAPDAADRDVLAAFAEHAGMALTAAKTTHAMQQAMKDPLTGLANRAQFADELGTRLAADGSESLGLLFVDLDRFKPVNDTLGHAAGDALLIEVASRIRDCLGGADIVARFGGDEFAALLVDTTLERATAVADRIGQRIRAPFDLLGRKVYVNASVGIALTDHRTDAAGLLRNADVAMYEAKRRGPGNQAVFERRMHKAMSTRLRLEADLDGILTRRELAVRYQPVVRLDDRAVVAVTATPYWKHPDLGMISPTDLLTSAKATQMVERITRALIEEACRQMQQWRSAGAAPVDLHVLIPAALLRDDDLLAAIGGPAMRYGIRPDQLVAEVDESTIAEDPPLAADRLEQMHRAGIRTAVTAFGNGGCSLRDLLRISADIVAIDVADAPDHNSASPPPLSQLLVRLAHMLDAAAMATGVDTHEQLAELDAAGYRYGRGSLFGCPADGTTTADRIRQAAVVHS